MHLFVNNLSNVDFSYLHPERGLVGETWLASIILEGTLDEQGMVCDFGIVKKTLRQWLDETIDHCLLVAGLAPQLQRRSEQDEHIELTWLLNQSTPRKIHCHSPKEAITVIDSDTITPQSVSAWCVAQLRTLLPDTLGRIQLSFMPEAILHNYYHYSHGLKKHKGNCQRNAHGHRSTIEIYQNNERNHALEQHWCELWQDIYIGSNDDLVANIGSLDSDYYTFAYQSQQGKFQLVLPKHQCYLIETDSTVEFIAQHIVQRLKAEQPEHHFRVRAFEGIDKGAIALSD